MNKFDIVKHQYYFTVIFSFKKYWIKEKMSFILLIPGEDEV